MTSRQLHLALTASWVLLLAPTLLWWRESILWVAFMSLYANMVGHWSAYQAARAEGASSHDDAQVDPLTRQHAAIMWYDGRS